MRIFKAVAWLFDVGDGHEAAALEQARSRDRHPRRGEGRGVAGDAPLYGEAEAIRVLYQFFSTEQSPPKPPRRKRGHGSWLARFLVTSGPSLRAPSAAGA
jgi:hypothetical protein